MLNDLKYLGLGMVYGFVLCGILFGICRIAVLCLDLIMV